MKMEILQKKSKLHGAVFVSKEKKTCFIISSLQKDLFNSLKVILNKRLLSTLSYSQIEMKH